MSNLIFALRYHHPSQLIRRIANHARRWLLRKTRGGRFARLQGRRLPLRPGKPLVPLLQWKLAQRSQHGAQDNARRILDHRFRLLGQEARLPDPVDWRMSDRTEFDHLWRFHLHYQEYLLDLMVDSAGTTVETRIGRAWQLVQQWIEGNPLSDVRGLDDAWHPFCISRRVPVWMMLWQAFPPEGEPAERVAESLFQQTMFLASHLERDLGGNHLLENTRALALAGSFFYGPQAVRWLETSRRILRSELPKQILLHGEHFERSPMYHAQMLDVLLQIRDATCDVAPDLARLCDEVIGPMAAFLDAIVHPDGEIPLLGDSAFGETAVPGDLIRQSGKTQFTTASGGGNGVRTRQVGEYWTWRDGDDYLLFDAGPVGADHLPAHAHSDLLTIEATLAGRRLIVDTGVCTYHAEPLRRICRSTSSHNVLQIDQREQCDTWSRFRMGYRGHPTRLETGHDSECNWARAQHNAFRRLGVPSVGRWICCKAGGPWLIVDWAVGSGSHRLSNWLHCHPDVTVTRQSAVEVHLQLGSHSMRLGALGEGGIDVVDGLYCPEFGRGVSAPVLRWTAARNLPTACGWWLAHEGDSGRATLTTGPDGNCSLAWVGNGQARTWPSSIVFGADSSARFSVGTD
ncbi:MAG: alginate lyase family protein [Planctomycetaceae bacterium]|nr:alginate lyase family protein [Planctomycetaceae bacterium]